MTRKNRRPWQPDGLDEAITSPSFVSQEVTGNRNNGRDCSVVPVGAA